jgi:hypothetical protein
LAYLLAWVLRGAFGKGCVEFAPLLFWLQQRIAPFILCTVGCGAGFGYNWTDFRVYDEALGRAEKENPTKPMYVINEGGEPYDWPWNEEVHAVDGIRVFKRPEQAESEPIPTSPPVPKKYPNPFRRRFQPGKKAGPMPKPKTSWFGVFGLPDDSGMTGT